MCLKARVKDNMMGGSYYNENGYFIPNRTLPNEEQAQMRTAQGKISVAILYF